MKALLFTHLLIAVAAALFALPGVALAQTAYSATVSGPWELASTWSPGSGTPGVTGDTASIGAFTVSSSLSRSLAEIIGVSGGTLNMSAGTINLYSSSGTCISYSGTSAGGFIEPIGTAEISASTSTGVCVYGSTTGTCLTPSQTSSVILQTSGGTAITETSGGYGIKRSSGFGAIVIAASGATAINNTSTGYGVYDTSGANSNSLSGAIYGNSAPGEGLHIGGGTWSIANYSVLQTASGGQGIVTAGGNLNLNGGTLASANSAITSNASDLYLAGGLTTWTGNAFVKPGSDAFVSVSTGTLACATSSGSLTLSSSGNFVLNHIGGTINTFVSGGGTAQFNSVGAPYGITLLGQNISPTYSGVINYPAAAGTSLTWEDGSTTPSGVTTLVVNGGTSDGSFGTTSGTITDVSAGSLTGGYFTTNLTGSNVAYNNRYGPSGGSLGTAPRPGPNMQAARTIILPGAIGAAAAIILRTFILVYLRRKQCR